MADRLNGARGTMDAALCAQAERDRAVRVAGAGASAPPDPRAHGAHGGGRVGTRPTQARPDVPGNDQGPQVPDPRLHVEPLQKSALNPAAAWPFPPSQESRQGPQVPVQARDEDSQPCDVPPTKEES